MADEKQGGELFSFLDDLNASSRDEVVWIDAGTLDQVVASGLRCLRIGGNPVGVLKRADGTFIAREMTCKHHGADLSAGERNGKVVTCPRHGWEYDLDSGKCVSHPSLPLRAYATKVEDGRLFVSSKPG
jgi:nitrite reductase/ring-hydroxylating ferredoxin subunit